MLTAALILHDVIYCYRSPQSRMPCSDWRRRVGVLLILCLEGRKKKIWIIPLNGHSCRREGAWGNARSSVCGTVTCFPSSAEAETHGCSVCRRQQTPQGGPRFPPQCVSAGRCGSWMRQSWSCSGTCCSRVPEKLFLYQKYFQPCSIVDGYI